MKTFVSGFISLFLFSSLGFAAPRQTQFDLDLEAMALVRLAQLQEAGDPEALRLAGIGDVFESIDQLYHQIKAIKEEIVGQFDTNGNGRIDPGPELDAFKETMQQLILLLADSNQNGRIDFQDIKVLTQLVLDQVKAKALEVACPTIIKEAEKAGWWLQFRPVLKHFYEICTFGA